MSEIAKTTPFLIGEGMTGGYGGADILNGCTIAVEKGEIADRNACEHGKGSGGPAPNPLGDFVSRSKGCRAAPSCLAGDLPRAGAHAGSPHASSSVAKPP